MYVRIGNAKYTKIKNLDFAPETDVTGSKIPINEFTVDIITADDIRNGAMAALYDDLDQLWARYWVTYAERMDRDTVQVRAQSRLILLGRRTMPAVRYSGAAVADVMADIFQPLGAGAYTLDSAFAAKTINGFCPEQSARERLLWVCFVIGAYVKTYFTDKIEILPIDETETTVPLERTYWKPTVTYRDHVTAVKATAYSFRQGTPQTTDKWVTDGTDYYIVTEQAYTLSNPDVPATAEENVISVDGLMLINSGNVDEVLSHLAKYHFKRTSMEFDCINNGEYEPGQKLTGYPDEEQLLTGFAESCSFTFGLQAKSKIVLTACEEKAGARLIIQYVHGNTQIGKRTYYFPIGYQYAIQNPYLDWSMGDHRYIFRPKNQEATGTIAAGEQTNQQHYAVALDLNKKTHVLKIVSVDSVTEEERSSGDRTIRVGVIA